MPTPATDTNLVLLAGTLVAAPIIRTLRGGGTRVDLTVAVRSVGPPRRVDAIPISCWDPPELPPDVPSGTRVTVVGAIRRRFWATDAGRESRLEVVAGQVAFDAAD